MTYATLNSFAECWDINWRGAGNVILSIFPWRTKSGWVGMGSLTTYISSLCVAGAERKRKESFKQVFLRFSGGLFLIYFIFA